MNRETLLKVLGGAGAATGYGCLGGFVILVGAQVYRWFRDAEWTHVGTGDALRSGLVHCCVKDGDTGRLAAFVHWLDAPVNWLGLHKLVELMPASFALFAVSILGNWLFIYCKDRLDQR
jgi:hypothetical protein